MQKPSLLLFAALALSQVAATEPLHFSQPCMGTIFTIHVYAGDKEQAAQAVAKAFARVEQINALASDYLPQSELNQLNLAPAQVPLPLSEDMTRLLSLGCQMARDTEGAFDITAAHAVQLWRRARRQKQLPSAEATRKAVSLIDWKALQVDVPARTLKKLKPGLSFDLGGIAKGYAADAALAVLKAQGFPQALVAASGDLAIGDAPPSKEGWNVTLRTFEEAEDKDRLLHVTLKNCGCSTSGDLHQFLELNGQRYSHIIDPKTGLGLTSRIACTIISYDATTSDALATAACVLGVERGLALLPTLQAQARYVQPSVDGTLEVGTTSSFPKPSR
jgi:FAD:protein FMN transferase